MRIFRLLQVARLARRGVEFSKHLVNHVERNHAELVYDNHVGTVVACVVVGHHDLDTRPVAKHNFRLCLIDDLLLNLQAQVCRVWHEDCRNLFQNADSLLARLARNADLRTGVKDAAAAAKHSNEKAFALSARRNVHKIVGQVHHVEQNGLKNFEVNA